MASGSGRAASSASRGSDRNAQANTIGVCVRFGIADRSICARVFGSARLGRVSEESPLPRRAGATGASFGLLARPSPPGAADQPTEEPRESASRVRYWAMDRASSRRWMLITQARGHEPLTDSQVRFLRTEWDPTELTLVAARDEGGRPIAVAAAAIDDVVCLIRGGSRVATKRGGRFTITSSIFSSLGVSGTYWPVAAGRLGRLVSAATCSTINGCSATNSVI